MRSRREPKDEHPRVRVTEGRHRLAPRLPVAISPPLLPRYGRAVLAQPRAELTGDDLLIQLDQPGRLHSLYSNSTAMSSFARRSIARGGSEKGAHTTDALPHPKLTSLPICSIFIG